MRAHLLSALFACAALTGCAAGIQSPLTASTEGEPVEDWSVLGDAAAAEAPADGAETPGTPDGAATPARAQTAATAGDYEMSFTEAPPPPPKAAPRPRHGFSAPPISKKSARVVSSEKK